MTQYGQAVTSHGQHLLEKGASPEEISAVLRDHAIGLGFEGPDPVTGLLIAGGLLIPAEAGIVLSAPVTLGSVAVGAVVSGGVEYYYQYDIKSGSVDLVSVGKASLIGGLTQGRSLPVTVMTNVSGEYVYKAFKGESIGASLVGASLGSAAGWKMADTVGDVGGNSIGSTKSVLGTILGSVVAKEVGSVAETTVGGSR